MKIDNFTMVRKSCESFPSFGGKRGVRMRCKDGTPMTFGAYDPELASLIVDVVNSIGESEETSVLRIESLAKLRLPSKAGAA